MNEAERFLKEHPGDQTAPEAREGGRSSSAYEDHALPSVDVQPETLENHAEPSAPSAKPSIGRYIVAALAFIGTFIGLQVLLEVCFGYKDGGGYLLKVIFFGAAVGAWRFVLGAR